MWNKQARSTHLGVYIPSLYNWAMTSLYLVLETFLFSFIVGVSIPFSMVQCSQSR